VSVSDLMNFAPLLLVINGPMDNCSFPSYIYLRRGRHIPPPYTPPYVHYIPDIYKIRLNKETDKFIILATDGLWDFMEPQEAVDIVASVLKAGPEVVRNDVLLCVKYMREFDKNGLNIAICVMF
jgi:serine/threonine protein phosphatase PrpC